MPPCPAETLFAGASVAVIGGFDTKAFCAKAREPAITRCWMTRVMATLLLKEAPQADDLDNPIELAVLVPFDATTRPFRERFGVEVRTQYNQTEGNIPLLSEENPRVLGALSRVESGVHAGNVDAHDSKVPGGEIGGQILRDDTPWALMHGYHGMPEAAAWCNGWFDTGAAFRRDEDRHFFYADWLEGSIRRWGEHVSSFVVERELQAYPATLGAAAIAVPAELAEDDVLDVIALQPGMIIDEVEPIRSLEDRMASFIVPGCIRIVDRLPMTDIGKVQKYIVRDEGVTPDRWDREAAGVRVRRERLSDAVAQAR